MKLVTLLNSANTSYRIINIVELLIKSLNLNHSHNVLYYTMFVIEKASWGRTIAVERAEKNALTTRSYIYIVW